LCYEIGLRLGSNINSLMTAAKTIIRKLHRIDISSIDALIDYLSEGDQRLVSASEIDPFPGPYATLKDGEMIIYLPKEKKMYIPNCSSLRVGIPRLFEDVKEMIGFSPGIYWRTSIKYFGPFFIGRIRYLCIPWRDQQVTTSNGVTVDSDQVKLNSPIGNAHQV
ncbi:hypothetical protein Anas_10641, partial [Armadillidium nasatum]